mmetsp:Transcript_21482/g.45281  ORF Transcript_21482/g.45281 Transcript_21482/m.45281 type:complete len:134 (+) Transcript_21482:936-1337(+)
MLDLPATSKFWSNQVKTTSPFLCVSTSSPAVQDMYNDILAFASIGNATHSLSRKTQRTRLPLLSGNGANWYRPLRNSLISFEEKSLRRTGRARTNGPKSTMDISRNSTIRFAVAFAEKRQQRRKRKRNLSSLT